MGRRRGMRPTPRLARRKAQGPDLAPETQARTRHQVLTSTQVSAGGALGLRTPAPSRRWPSEPAPGPEAATPRHRPAPPSLLGSLLGRRCPSTAALKNGDPPATSKPPQTLRILQCNSK